MTMRVLLVGLGMVLAGGPSAWAVTSSETRTEMNEGETILGNLRMFLRDVKENVPGTGKFEFPCEGTGETHQAVAEASAGSVTLSGTSYATTHKLTVSTNGSIMVVALLGKTESGSAVGELAVYMGNSSAQVTVKYLLPPDTNEGAQIEVATADGWTFEREKGGVVHTTDPNGGHATTSSGVTCVFPGQLSDEDIRTIQGRVDAGESFQTVIASYGGSCS